MRVILVLIDHVRAIRLIIGRGETELMRLVERIDPPNRPVVPVFPGIVSVVRPQDDWLVGSGSLHVDVIGGGISSIRGVQNQDPHPADEATHALVAEFAGSATTMPAVTAVHAVAAASNRRRRFMVPPQTQSPVSGNPNDRHPPTQNRTRPAEQQIYARTETSLQSVNSLLFTSKPSYRD